MQFTLNELFRRRDGRTLTCEAYRALGGLEGALANHAEATLAALPPEVQAALPALLRALVTAGEGDHEPVVSRRVPLEPLRIDPIRRRLLDVLIDARLLLTDRDDRMQPVVGIAHEALLTHWPRLKDLLDKDREFLRARTRAAAAAERWRRESRDVDFLLPEGKPLAEARELLKTRRDDLDPETIEFIQNSIRYRTRQKRRFIRLVASLTLTLLCVVSVFAAFSYIKWQDALKQQHLAYGEKLVADEQTKIAEQKTELAVREKDIALEAIDTLTEMPERLRNIPGTIPVVTSILDEALPMLDRILELEPETKQAERKKRILSFEIGDLLSLMANKQRARKAYERSHAILLELARNKTDAGAKRDLSVSYDKLGDIFEDQGNLPRAHRGVRTGPGDPTRAGPQ